MRLQNHIEFCISNSFMTLKKFTLYNINLCGYDHDCNFDGYEKNIDNIISNHDNVLISIHGIQGDVEVFYDINYKNHYFWNLFHSVKVRERQFAL